MAPKQGTLKYVKPSQKTLNKWFSGQSVPKTPQPQQSKLKLKAKDSEDAETPEPIDEDVKSEAASAEVKGDVDMEDVPSSKVLKSEEGTSPKSE
ncbi:hypothetical protein BT63DRAFT_457000 [Microthyrium microscopicum]|uniref:Uncharacterized protein n=1 Tax=Microthyrium microscopicum TaxID=703497 RepID=A0A6A6U628_9PEZI|nr:hypothetical protein BT63DRAFT_457000 [Microthyrium microscopicum]